jgi:hypothetical protein
MKTLLWIVQVILGVLYLMGGLYKLFGAAPAMEAMMPGFTLPLIRTVAVVETLAALGLLVPVVARRKQMWAACAGLVLAVEAVLFVVYHIAHKAWGPAVATVLLGFLAGWVAKARSRRASA